MLKKGSISNICLNIFKSVRIASPGKPLNRTYVMGGILSDNHLKLGKNVDVKTSLLIPMQRFDAELLKICKQFQSSYFCTVLDKIGVKKFSGM